MAFIRNYSKFVIKSRLRPIFGKIDCHRNISNSFAPVISSTPLCHNTISSSSSTQYSKNFHLKRQRFLYAFTQQSNLSTTSQLHNSQFDSGDSFSTQRNDTIASTFTEPSLNKVIFLENEPISSSSEFVSEVSSTGLDVPLTSETADIATTLSADLTSAVAEAVEPTLASLGLVNYTPVGLVQACLEYLHVSMGMPWWVSIALATAVARVLMFPIFVKTQRSAARMSNYMPQVQYLQQKFGEARRTGNSYEASRNANEMMSYMKKYDINPLKTAAIPMLQAPVFLSFFIALRSMAKLPVESMKYGGISWFTDLTIPDPYYALPVMACSTLFVILKAGAESGVRMENMKMSRYIVGAIPVIALPFCINFPTAVLVYWCTNNFLTLLLVLMVKIEPVRIYLDIPKKKPVDQKFVLPKKGFVQGFKESFEDQRIIRALEDRQRVDDVRFRKAGTGPIPRTYSYDPTKPRPANAAAAAARQSSMKS